MKRGTTLVEILVVIALLGIVATVVTPALPRATEDSAEHAAAGLLRTLRTTRSRALREGRRYQIIIAPRQRRLWLLTPDSASRLSELAPIDENVKLEARADRLRFTFGAVGESNDDSLVIYSPTESMVLAIDPLTGEPRASRR